MTFCATIWESNIPIVLISATPQMISANAIGMPSAIAPSSEKVKTAMVIMLRVPHEPARHQCSSDSLTATMSASLAWPETTRNKS